MILLGIDTSEGHCSAALYRYEADTGGRVLASRSEDIGRGHAERLIPLIEEMLADQNLEFSDLEKIAVTTGPGTFTGLRIGISVARGLALALSIPCVGISTLNALAYHAAIDGKTGYIHAALMGRGGQAFHQVFEGRSIADVKPVTEGASRFAKEIKAEMDAYSGILIGSGAALPELDGRIVPICPETICKVCVDLDAIDHPPEPTYLRPPDAKVGKPLLPIAAA